MTHDSLRELLDAHNITHKTDRNGTIWARFEYWVESDLYTCKNVPIRDASDLDAII